MGRLRTGCSPTGRSWEGEAASAGCGSGRHDPARRQSEDQPGRALRARRSALAVDAVGVAQGSRSGPRSQGAGAQHRDQPRRWGRGVQAAWMVPRGNRPHRTGAIRRCRPPLWGGDPISVGSTCSGWTSTLSLSCDTTTPPATSSPCCGRKVANTSAEVRVAPAWDLPNLPIWVGFALSSRGRTADFECRGAPISAQGGGVAWCRWLL